MSKSITKIVKAALGLTMAIGAGVGAATSNRVVKGLSAATSTGEASITLGSAAAITDRWAVGKGSGVTNSNSTVASTWAAPSPDSGEHTYTDTMANADQNGQKWSVTWTYTGAFFHSVNGGTPTSVTFGKASNPPTTLTFVSTAFSQKMKLTAFSSKYGDSSKASTIRGKLYCDDTLIATGAKTSSSASETKTVSKSGDDIIVQAGSVLKVVFDEMSNGVKIYDICYTLAEAPADPSKTVQANSVTIKSGANTISGTYEPNAPYYIGETLDLTQSFVAYEQGDNYENGTGVINWTSSAPSVATVSDGVVTFVSAGTTTITATAADKGAGDTTVSASFTLDVRNATYAPGTENNPYTVAQALAAPNANDVYVVGKISSIEEVSLQYHNATYYISDDGSTNNQLYIFHGKYTGNTNFTAVHQIQVGDTVTITGNLTVHNETKELNSNNYITSLTPVQYSVVYNANGADSGTVPIDSNTYARNINAGVATVTTKANSGNLTKEGFTFNGWNTKADPTAQGASHYNANAEIEIGSNVELYAEWLSTAPSIIVTSGLDGYTGEVIDLDFTYGNIADESAINVVASNANVIIGDIIADDGEGIVEVTLKTAGTASLSFRNGGSELATCSVSIAQSAVTITGLPANDLLAIGDTLNLKSKISVTAVGTVSNKVTWVSDNPGVATVSDQGVVTAVAVGSANITVTADDYPTATMSCSIEVTFGMSFNLTIDQTALQSEEMVVWGSESIGMMLNKGTSSTNANNYLGGGDNGNYKHTRVYKDQVLIVVKDAKLYKFDKVVFTATSSDYATTFAGSVIDNALVERNGSTVTLTPKKGAENIIIHISAATRFNSVKIYYSQADAKQQIEYGIKTSSSLSYNFVKNGENDFTFSNIKVKFGGYVTKALWNSLNSESAIQGYGIMISTADNDPAGYLGDENFKDEYFAKLSEADGNVDTAIASLCDNVKIFNFFKSGTPFLHESAKEANYTEDTYAWNLVQNINTNHLTRTYVAIAYIRTNDGLVFLKEERISVANIANRMVESGDYNEDPLFESLSYLANL